MNPTGFVYEGELIADYIDAIIDVWNTQSSDIYHAIFSPESWYDDFIDLGFDSNGIDFAQPIHKTLFDVRTRRVDNPLSTEPSPSLAELFIVATVKNYFFNVCEFKDINLDRRVIGRQIILVANACANSDFIISPLPEYIQGHLRQSILEAAISEQSRIYSVTIIAV